MLSKGNLEKTSIMKRALAYDKRYAFNAICPYYTMFPLEYPLRIIKHHKKRNPVVLDPFCGRGTTIYAARKANLTAFGSDTSPIAAAISKAKLARSTVEDVLDSAREFLANSAKAIPENEFFSTAFSDSTLEEVCAIREGLLSSEGTDSNAILRAVMLGCLHGPLQKTPGYFSNQMPRTFATKPAYSVKYWNDKGLNAPKVSVIDVIERKLNRIADLNTETNGCPENIRCADATSQATYEGIPKSALIITSPPYYGMRTYVQDQWLRMWFLGGDDEVRYENKEQMSHQGNDAFISDLSKVWINVRENSTPDAHLYVRFGSIPSIKSDPKYLLKSSIEQAEGWKLISTRNANPSGAGKRQASQMGSISKPSEEYDFHAVLA